MIDTHTHLYVEQFKEDIDVVISRARNSGVKKFYLPAIDRTTHKDMLDLESRYPELCIAMMGVHPCSVNADYKVELQEVEEWLLKRKFVAIGEIGLDFYWDQTFKEEQYIAFHQQIEWALKYNLPIVIHSRNSTAETIDVVRQYRDKGLRGIFHCFGGSLEEANAITELGFMLGIGGVVTYKKSGLDVVLKDVEMKHIVLETDAPYLTPVPFRGKRNEPSYLKYVAEKIAEIKQISVEKVISITTENAGRVFDFI